MKISNSDKDRFFEKHDWLKADDKCWEWKAYRSHKGYGKFQIGRKSLYAHRVAWVIHNGPIPDGLHVLHKCDNPPCCNPNHLFLGTNADNTQDKVKKNRQIRLRGELAGTSKLTEDQVISLLNERMAGASTVALAKKYGINNAHCSDICRGKVWAHLLGRPGVPSYQDLMLRQPNKSGAILTEDQVKYVMRRLGEGEAGKSIARDYNVHFATISDIKNGLCWSELAGKNGLPTINQMQTAKPKSKFVAKITEKMAKDIKNMISQGRSCTDIARHFGVSIGAISHIKTGRTWGSI